MNIPAPLTAALALKDSLAPGSRLRAPEGRSVADRYRLDRELGPGGDGYGHAIEIAARHGVADATLARLDPSGSTGVAGVASRRDAWPSSGFSRVVRPR